MKSKGSQNAIKKILNFNRKMHILFGLFLLLFIWLFFISGLIINHGGWKFASFYEQRKERKTDFSLPMTVLNYNPDMVNQILVQLRISGEVENLQLKPGNIDFRVQSPGIVRDIHINSKSGNGTLKEMNYNFWGKLKTLHLFNGVAKTDPSKSPNWIITKIWRLTMDVTAIILIILCVGSWVMWYKVRKDYRLGYIMIGLGFIISGYFIFLLGYL